MMRRLRAYCSLFALCLMPLVACNRGPLDCPRGEVPRGDVCVPIGVADAGIPDTGEPLDLGVDSGIVIRDAGDAGFVDPFDGSLYDSGYVAPAPSVTAGARDRILLRGTVVLPMGAENAITGGEVYVANGRIACVGARDACAAMSAGAELVETGGVIMPGLVDAHNHVAYNWLPEWVSGRTWVDHQEWQGSMEYEIFTDPYRDNSDIAPSFCAMVQWGELRALVSGTTTIYGAVAQRACFRWLVRNAELSTGYNGFSADRMRSNVLGIDSVNETMAAALIADMNAGEVAAYMIHVSEGVSDRARREFDEVERLGLLRPETVLIHGTALGPAHFSKMAMAGTKLVWSPSSNLALYGLTTDVAEARLAGVEIAIAPDWTPSGVDEPLRELRAARQAAPGVFTDRELVDRVTSVAAKVMAIDADVGSLAVGRLADLLVLTVEPGDPYASVIAARPSDVRLVMIDGVPTYGDPALMDAMAETPASCHDFVVCGTYRRACWVDTPDGPVSPTSIADVITSFYPGGPWSLFECH